MFYFFLYLAGRRIVTALPLALAYRLASFAADIFRLFAREDKKNLRRNLKTALNQSDKKLIDAHVKNVFRNFAKYLADFFRLEKLDQAYIKEHITIEGRENLDEALKEGKGVMCLSAHLGNWELGAAVVARLGYPIYAIVLDHKNKKVNDFFVRQRSLSKVGVIRMGPQIKNCFKILKENSVIAIMGDRDFANHGEKINFFGSETLFPKGPAFFALRTGAPIVPTFMIRSVEDEKFRFIFEKPITARNRGNDEEGMKNIMQEYISVIERYIRLYPGQWYAFKDMWSQN